MQSDFFFSFPNDYFLQEMLEPNFLQMPSQTQGRRSARKSETAPWTHQAGHKDV